MNSIRLGKTLLSIDKPLIMGILNLTSDSFYDGGLYIDSDKALNRVGEMLDEGADLIDIGAFSSRPGAALVSAEAQIAKLRPFITRIVEEYPDVSLSIDTIHGQVVQALAEVTPFLVNDISGFTLDETLLTAVAANNLPYVLMHMRGTPENMQSMTTYEDVCLEILGYFSTKIRHLRELGIVDVIVDPGFGFAKNLEQNYAILSKLNLFNMLERPVLVGLSRKSMVYQPLQSTPAGALNGTTALHMTALMNGARILRVHDVKEAVETRTLWLQLSSPS